MNTTISHINGHIARTDSQVRVGRVDISMSFDDAWALCNMLDERRLAENKHMLEDSQVARLMSLGARIGLLIDHPSRDNVGKVSITQAPLKEIK